MLDTLRGHALLYQKLKDGTSLSHGHGFLGTRHCEACFAALSSLLGEGEASNDQLRTLLLEFAGSGQTIGVSKRCCPVCARLLQLLKTHDGKPFITTGEHSTITPCTLPEWLPKQTIETIVVEFGGRLRKELVKLQQRTATVLRRRNRLTDTRRISLDSIRAREVIEENTAKVAIAFASLSRSKS